MKISHFSLKEVEAALEKYHKVVEATDLTRKTKDTYLLHADHFVRWLEDKFEPGSRKK